MDKQWELAYTAWRCFDDQLRDRYGIKHRQTEFRARQGSADRKGEQFYRAFLEIGKVCCQHGIDPLDYIEVSFQLIGKNVTHITPRDFCGVVPLRMYQEYRARRQDDNLFSWLGQLKELLQILEQQNDLQADKVLLDPRRPFEAWFRVIYLEECTDDIFRQYGDAAQQQLRHNEKLRRFARQQKPQQVAELERRTARLPPD